MSAEKVIEVAEAEVGTTEYPKGSNKVKYNTDYYGFEASGSAYPWCCSFLWWIFNEAGEGKAFFNGGKTASCTALMQLYQAEGRWYTDGKYQKGDIPIMTFNAQRSVQHCGLIIGSGDNGGWLTVEGNTSPGLEGSQDNGGCVAKKERYNRNILGVCRPKYSQEVKPVNDWENIKWASKEIKWNIDNGIMTGYPDGSFKPNNPVTRAEESVMNYRLYEKIEREFAELRKEIARK